MIPRGSIITPVAVIGLSGPLDCVLQMMFTTAVRAVAFMAEKSGAGCVSAEAFEGFWIVWVITRVVDFKVTGDFSGLSIDCVEDESEIVPADVLVENMNGEMVS